MPRLANSDVDSLRLDPIGHVMNLDHALAQEAIVTARAFNDGGASVRGGPWAFPSMGCHAYSQMKEVRKLADQAADGAAARKQVLEYASRCGGKFLKHCEDKDFHLDNAPFGKKRRMGKLTGNQRRKRDGLVYGSAGFKTAKYGVQADATESAIQSKYNATRPDRASGH